MIQVLITAIGAVATVLTTIITNHSHAKEFEKNMSKMVILQMITEDRLNIMQGKLPLNYQAILTEFDTYTKDGGNSYIHDKVEEYKTIVENSQRR